jgi:hypothetical protein
MHAVLLENRSKFADDDPINRLLDRLGPALPLKPNSENETIALELAPRINGIVRRDDRSITIPEAQTSADFNETEHGNDDFKRTVDPNYVETTKVLCLLLKQLPDTLASQSTSLIEFLSVR